MPQALFIVRMEGPLHIVRERVGRRTIARDHAGGVHEAVVAGVVVQPHGVADLMHRGTEIGRTRSAEALARDLAPGCRIGNRPVAGDAGALARDIVRIPAIGVVHDAPAGGVQIADAEQVVAPLIVQIGAVPGRQHGLVHLGVGPGIAARLDQVHVALDHVDLPVDLVEDMAPVDVGPVGGFVAAGLRQFRLVDPVDLDHRPPEIGRDPAHGQIADHGTRGALHGTRQVVGARGPAGRGVLPAHHRGEGAVIVPGIGGLVEAVAVEAQREAVAEGDPLQDLGDAQIVAIAVAREDGDLGDLRFDHRLGRPGEGGVQVQVAAGGRIEAGALHPQGPVIMLEESVDAGGVPDEVAAVAQRFDLDRHDRGDRQRRGGGPGIVRCGGVRVRIGNGIGKRRQPVGCTGISDIHNGLLPRSDLECRRIGYERPRL